MQVARLLAIAFTAASCGSQAAAQQHGTAHQGHGAAATPYAGLEARPVKALSEQQIADLRAGRGMGLALAAELNGYPGPTHVIENAAALGLSPDQLSQVQGLFDSMKAETIPLGEQLIAAEAELDRSFGSRTVTEASLGRATAAIGALQGELRAAHLKYHLSTVDVLTPAQVRRYNELRGYSGAGAGEHR